MIAAAFKDAVRIGDYNVSSLTGITRTLNDSQHIRTLHKGDWNA
jgi:hypothetical protein